MNGSPYQQPWYANPFLQLGMGILAGNQGGSGSAAFSNAMKSGLSALNQAQINAMLMSRERREQAAEGREKEQFRAQQALPGIMAGNYTPQGQMAAIAAADPTAFAKAAAGQMFQQPDLTSAMQNWRFLQTLPEDQRAQFLEMTGRGGTTVNVSTGQQATPQQMALSALDDLEQQAESFFGDTAGERVDQVLTGLGGAVGTSTVGALWDSSVRSAVTPLARAFGETGPLSDQDRANAAAMLPDIYRDSRETALGKIRKLKNRLTTYAGEVDPDTGIEPPVTAPDQPDSPTGESGEWTDLGGGVRMRRTR